MTRYLLLALTVLAAPAAAQITATLPVTCNASGSICTQATPVSNPDGTAIGSGGGSSTRTTAAGTSDTLAVPVQGVTGGVPQRITGDAANGTTDSGAPLKIGGLANSGTPAAVLSGQRVNSWFGLNGQNASMIVDAGGSSLVFGSATVDSSSASRTVLPVYSFGVVYNPTTVAWDRARGDTNGAYSVNKGGSSLATGQISVGTAATLVAAARTGRGRLVITQSAAGPCYYGPTNTVTATTGARLAAAGASKVYQYAGALYGICPGGAVTTDVDEEF